MLTWKDIMDHLVENMKSSVLVYAEEMSGISAGRVTPSLLSSVVVKVYGTNMSLPNLASISVQDTRVLIVQVWDTGNVSAVSKAIIDANLGLVPLVEGNVIRINVPPLTEDRRNELIKAARKCLERCKVSLRNIRRNAIDELKKNEKSLGISEDEKHKYMEEVQKTTDDFVSKIDKMLEVKERDIMDI